MQLEQSTFNTPSFKVGRETGSREARWVLKARFLSRYYSGGERPHTGERKALVGPNRLPAFSRLPNGLRPGSRVRSRRKPGAGRRGSTHGQETPSRSNQTVRGA